jgi:hypothetical protein
MSHPRELSNGHFSDDNQKRLNGSNADIPIYEAKMTRDSRLVVSCLESICNPSPFSLTTWSCSIQLTAFRTMTEM